MINNKIRVRNKKAEVSVTILVFMTVAICGIALFTFLTKSGKITKTIGELGVFQELSVEEEEYIFSIESLASQLTSDDAKQEFREVYARSAGSENKLLNKYLPSLRNSLENPNSEIKIKDGKARVFLKDFKFYVESKVKLEHYRDIYFEIDLKTSNS